MRILFAVWQRYHENDGRVLCARMVGRKHNTCGEESRRLGLMVEYLHEEEKDGGKIIMRHEVRYRLELNCLSHDRDDMALETSEPIYTLAEGKRKFNEEIKHVCADDKTVPVRAHLWKYSWDADGRCVPITIMKNY